MSDDEFDAAEWDEYPDETYDGGDSALDFEDVEDWRAVIKDFEDFIEEIQDDE